MECGNKKLICFDILHDNETRKKSIPKYLILNQIELKPNTNSQLFTFI